MTEGSDNLAYATKPQVPQTSAAPQPASAPAGKRPEPGGLAERIGEHLLSHPFDRHDMALRSR